MKFEKPVNPNYCGTVVEISNLHPLAGCDNLAGATILGNQVIVSKDLKIGTKGVFFPLETAIDAKFLAINNLFSSPQMNNDTEKRGYFDAKGRVRAVKLRCHKSEGFFIELSAFAYLAPEKDFPLGQDFDKIGSEVICKKYTVVVPDRTGKKFEPRKKARRSRLVENQFRLHIDTANLRKNIYEIKPTDTISITNKIHGTSWIVGNILTKKKLNFFERFLKFLGVAIIETVYDIVYSSRGVIKNQWQDGEDSGLGFYKYDLWKDIAERVKSVIPKGFTLYGEAVGQLPSGADIQKGYTYGAVPKTFDIYVYRITSTNADGKVIELSHAEIRQFCEKNGLKSMQQFFYGKAEILTDLSEMLRDDSRPWNEYFLSELESIFIKDRMCPLNGGAVPEEGIVVRVDDLYEFKAFKLKNFLFLGKETKDLDAGISDIESEEAAA